MFTEKDYQQIAKQGIPIETIQQQISHFVNGFPYLKVLKAATVGDGIVRVEENELEALVKAFDAQTDQVSLLKFVPASGAATRMFKALFAFKDEGKSDKSIVEFSERLRDFAFLKIYKASWPRRAEPLKPIWPRENFGRLRIICSRARGWITAIYPKDS